MKPIDTFKNRLQKAMNTKNMRQVDLVEKTGLDKTLINKYLAGIMNARQDKLTILADALDVNEVWLMGYDVSMERDLNEHHNTNDDFRYASYNGIDTEGLDENDIEEINRFVEFIKNKKKDEKK